MNNLLYFLPNYYKKTFHLLVFDPLDPKYMFNDLVEFILSETIYNHKNYKYKSISGLITSKIFFDNYFVNNYYHYHYKESGSRTIYINNNKNITTTFNHKKAYTTIQVFHNYLIVLHNINNDSIINIHGEFIL